MPRFTLTQLLMGTALIAIGFALVRSEGCGRRHARIESLSFSSDDSRIAVVKWNWRTFRRGGFTGVHTANACRTISWLDSASGKLGETIQQDLRRGHLGIPLMFWFISATPALFDPGGESITAIECGGKIMRAIGSASETVVPTLNRVFNLAYSPSGRFLAASGWGEMAVLDTRRNSVVMRVPAESHPSIDGCLMAFSIDDEIIVTASRTAVHVWDIATSSELSTFLKDSGSRISSISVLPDQTVIVCTDHWVRRFDMAGNTVAEITSERGDTCSAASDGSRLAVCNFMDDTVSIYDLNSNALVYKLPIGVPTIAMSSDGGLLALGDFRGQVTLIDAASGSTLWTSSPPGRIRWAWPGPAACLAVWCYIARRLAAGPKVRVTKPVTE